MTPGVGVGPGGSVFAAVAGRCGAIPGWSAERVSVLVILVGACTAPSVRVVDPRLGAKRCASWGSSGASTSSSGARR